MMRFVELLIFGAIAGSLHVGVFFVWTEAMPGGRQGGDGGAAALSLQATPEPLAALVEKWDAPPETSSASAKPVKLLEPLTLSPPQALAAEQMRRVAQPLALPDIAAPDAFAILRRGPGIQQEMTTAQFAALPEHQTPTHQSAIAPAPPPARPKPVSTAPSFSTPTLDTSPAQPTAQPIKHALRPRPRPIRATKTPNAESPPSPQLVASGAASAPRAATGRTTHTDGARSSTGQMQRLEAAWGAAIQAKVQRAARNPGTGPATVRVQLSVAPSGQLVAVRVAGSSGDRKADQSALRAVKRAKRFKPAPDGLTNPQYTFQVTLRFQ